MRPTDSRVRRHRGGNRSTYGLCAASLALALARAPLCPAASPGREAQPVTFGPVSIATSGGRDPGRFALYANGRATPVYVASEDFSVVRLVTSAFADDFGSVTGRRPEILAATAASRAKHLIIIGTVGHSPLLDRLRASGRLDTSPIDGKWESALTTIVSHPFPDVDSALVIAGSDRRGTAFAVFDLSRRIGVSPWTWWADVPPKRREFLAVNPGTYIQGSPSVRYRGIFLNDEDWGLRPWAARRMDPQLHNIGPHTYARVFELLLRLRANTLWPAMHPGTLPFNAVPENAVLADKWGIVMGSSHAEPLLRNNVGEWDEKADGPWDYQLNRAAIIKYWDDRLKTNGRFENIYTVGMRGVHDSPMEATGTPGARAGLLERIIAEQRELLAKRVSPDVATVPQVLWLYKEVLELYRVGMRIPDDVTLGWTDDNYGYIRQLPDRREQARPGGSGLYYHVSYWGEPHDYLWLCSTPPALMREELTKAWDHGVRRMWILNVGDLKPAETDIDYFMRMAWNEPAMARLSQRDFLTEWSKEQFPGRYAKPIANLMDRYYRLSFVRKPEFMGFNENDRPIERTAFNPLAWGDQNRQRLQAWRRLSKQAAALGKRLPREYGDAYFELVSYPIEGAAAQNEKFLWNDRSYLDAAQGRKDAEQSDAERVKEAYDRIQSLTRRYNSLAGGKWDGMMSSHPRNLPVFEMPVTAESGGRPPALPKIWGGSGSAGSQPASGTGFAEEDRTVSIDAAHFTSEHNAARGAWHVRPQLGLPGGSVLFGEPGATPEADWVGKESQDRMRSLSTAPWIEYAFTTRSEGDALLSLYLLPTYPVDSEHHLRYAVVLDGGKPVILDGDGADGKRSDVTSWSSNVLRNSEIETLDLGKLPPGRHRLRLIHGDPGVIFEHIVVTFPGAPPAYPFPPETRTSRLR